MATTTVPLPLGVTEKGSATYLSTSNPCLDFFFHVVSDTAAEEVVDRLDLAWEHDPLTALKLVCNLRGVRGTGKSDKEGFFTAALWLHKNHPKTLACNVKAIAHFGSLKDVVEVLYRLLEGPDCRKNQKNDWESNKEVILNRVRRRNNKRKSTSDSVAAAVKSEKKAAKANKAAERYIQDPDYQFLHDQVSDLFAEFLRSDVKLYDNGELYKISMAAKWCPSLGSSYDKATLMCESVAKKVFPREDFIEYQDIEDTHYVYKVRDRLRKEILVPLHKALELPEVYMCANRWGEFSYERVPSVAMNKYKDLFLKHDEEGFNNYLERVRGGESTIAAGALLPHEIIATMKDSDCPQVAELQWQRMVDDLAKKGKLRNCMAICDVSETMEGTPMDVSVALGLLISELSEEPWKGKLITYSSEPQFHEIRGTSLESKIDFIREMERGANMDFEKVFDHILDVTLKGNLGEDQMIKTLFVFSDMEFDQAWTNGNWETDYMVIQRKFQAKGYKVPDMVFWNLRNSKATPVPSSQPGVALVSGFSKNLVKLFLEGGGIVSPEALMQQAISGEEYKKLVVYD